MAKSENAGMGRKTPFMDGHYLETRSAVSIYKSRATPDHGLRRSFSTP
jgi:hypothetical protein